MKLIFKYTMTAMVAMVVQSTFAQTHQLEKLWETDTVVRVPESVLPDLKKGVLFVSEIEGNPNAVDGKGGVAKIGLDGKIVNLDFTTGLNAPKGLGRFGNELYAADLSEVVVIDINTGKVKNKIAIDSAKALNDITVNDKGIVYVSDSKTKKIHRIENGHVSTFLTNVSGVNGLKAIGADLYILGGQKFMRSDSQGNLTQITTLSYGGDGIEPVGNGDFLITCWSGHIFYVTASGKIETLLDIQEKKVNTADLAYDNVKQILYVPTFWGNKVMAYKLITK